MKEKKKSVERDAGFALLARKLRRRRIIAALALAAAAALITVCIVNYKEACVRTEPPVVISEKGVDNGQTVTTVYYSLGFKQVSYESGYGKNYCERMWLWEDVDMNPPVLTPSQYSQLMKQLYERYQSQRAYEPYFETFQTYEARILDVEKEGNQYRIYMSGGLYDFVEYGNVVYTGIDGEPEGSRETEYLQQPLIVAATWDGSRMKLEKVRQFQTGDEGSGDIFKNFPKSVAVRLLASIEGQDDTGQKAMERAKIKAAAHFGKPVAEDTYLYFDLDTEKARVYQIVPDQWDPEDGKAPQENDRLIKEEKLKKAGSENEGV